MCGKRGLLSMFCGPGFSKMATLIGSWLFIFASNWAPENLSFVYEVVMLLVMLAMVPKQVRLPDNSRNFPAVLTWC